MASSSWGAREMAQWWKDTLQNLRQIFTEREPRPSPSEANPPKSDPPAGSKVVTDRSVSPAPSVSDSSKLSSTKPPQSAPSAANKSGSSPSRTRSAIVATLGIDFGTRFTKVVLQSEGSSRPLSLGGVLLLPSRIGFADGQFYPPDLQTRGAVKWIEYLKMRLMAGSELSFSEGDHIKAEDVRPLAALYLSGVLRLATEASFKSGLNRNVEIKWNAQVGVPVKTYGSPDLATFQEVAGVAWAWKDSVPTPQSMADLHRSYKQAKEALANPDDLPIGVAPELVAAISHIASRRDAPEGLYALIDIGGGTLDGTSFVLRRSPQVSVDILAAEVKSLGTVPICHALSQAGEPIDKIEQNLISRILSAPDQRKLFDHSEKVASVLRFVLALAIKKRPGLGFITWGLNKLDKAVGAAKYRPVDVLLAGGGAPSAWYQTAFKKLDMKAWAIDPLRPQVIPKPMDWRDDTYPRFVVANGLSNRELLIRYRWTLPDDNKPQEDPPERKPPFEQPTSKEMI